jgi:hypothetical protein
MVSENNKRYLYLGFIWSLCRIGSVLFILCYSNTYIENSDVLKGDEYYITSNKDINGLTRFDLYEKEKSGITNKTVITPDHLNNRIVLKRNIKSPDKERYIILSKEHTDYNYLHEEKNEWVFMSSVTLSMVSDIISISLLGYVV